ncbi:hypothetical protein N658DRAFT_456532 [Parathielavia hyrcaniae]|uniref:Uncharacterized protein n=1 Tax=Parathielavia hyrcaniae TaxID=113614 RepID=A0AAN6PTW4_9PEZI|nr:hypothetical protein N658DRAFT_456532 [Parathielavia hyrcaniae]
MEGQNQVIKLSPYYRQPQSGLRGPTRHGFLSNRWGLQGHRPYHTPSRPVEQPSILSQARVGPQTVPTQLVQFMMDRDLCVLRGEVRSIGDSVQRLEKAAETMAKQSTQGIEKILELHDSALGNADMRRIEDGRHETQVLQQQREMDKMQIEGLEENLRLASLHAALATRELSEARLAQCKEEDMDHQAGRREDPDKAVKAAYLSLRDPLVEFTNSLAIPSGPLPNHAVATTTTTDTWFHPPAWNRASPRQRRLRVTARIFHLLFRRILRPGLRLFGVQAFLRCTQHHAISAAEAQLRALEKELEAQGVDNRTLKTWIATTIDTIAPVRDIPRNSEGVAREILEALSPVIYSSSSRNFMNKTTSMNAVTAKKLTTQISSICEQAVRLKLAMRRASGGRRYKIEVPSRDAKKWGEAGCDDETRALRSGAWLQVVDHEGEEVEDMGPSTIARPARRGPHAAIGGDVAYVPFGALTRAEEGPAPGGERRKVVLERGWVVARFDDAPGSGGGMKKRKGLAGARAGEEEGQPQKRIKVEANRGVSLAHLARVRALMGQQSV